MKKIILFFLLLTSQAGSASTDYHCDTWVWHFDFTLADYSTVLWARDRGTSETTLLGYAGFVSTEGEFTKYYFNGEEVIMTLSTKGITELPETIFGWMDGKIQGRLVREDLKCSKKL